LKTNEPTLMPIGTSGGQGSRSYEAQLEVKGQGHTRLGGLTELSYHFRPPSVE